MTYEILVQMKKTTAFFFILTLLTYYCHAQKKLNDNPVFFELAQRNIHYPIIAIKLSLYGRIYTKFAVNKIGKISNIEVIYPLISPEYEKKIGFIQEIKRGLSKLPILGLGYEGEYIVPVAFIFNNHNDHPELAYPTNRLPNSFDTEDMIFLDELKIHGRSDIYPTIISAFFSVQIDEQ